MNDVLHMLLGAALVTIGVLASALADRIRQLRLTRHDDTHAPVHAPVRAATRAPRAKQNDDVLAPGADDVVAALVATGYRKAQTMQAVAACAPREQATPESWTAAALRHCAGGAS
jgi:Holliday junction resolvasome RuvABC DNA-binding subunit